MLTANIVQSDFRARNDDGNETTATWKAAVNTNWTQNVDEIFRLRLARLETAGGALNNTSHAIEYSLNGGTWTTITTTTPVQFTASANVADNTATTQQITSGTYSGDPSEVDSDGNVQNAPSWAGNDYVEYEAVLTIDSAQVANNDSLQIRHAGLNGYTNTPTITVNEATNTNVTSDFDTITVTEFDTTVNNKTDVLSDFDTITVTDFDATVKLGKNIVSDFDTITVTEFDTTVNNKTEVVSDFDTITVTEFDTSVNAKKEVLSDFDTITVTEFDTTVTTSNNTNITSDFDTITVTEFDSTVVDFRNTDIVSDFDTITITDFDSSLGTITNIVSDFDTITVTEFDTTIDRAVNVVSDFDTITVTDFDSVITKDYHIISDFDTITINGLNSVAGQKQRKGRVRGKGSFIFRGRLRIVN